MMKRTRLKRIASITHSDENIRKYKKQRNLVVKMNKQEKLNSTKTLVLTNWTLRKRSGKRSSLHYLINAHTRQGILPSLMKLFFAF